MPSAGPNSPGTLANASINTNNWTNPSNAGASDNAYATLAADGNPGRLDGYNLGFAIPAGSSIDGIVVEVEIKISTGSDWLDANLAADLPGGSGFAWMKSASYDTTEGYKTFGSSSDTWGRAWTAAEINSSNFGAFVKPEAASGTVSVDHIRVTVYYTDLTTVSDTENLGANVTEAEALVFALDDAENAAANVTEAETVVAHQVVTPATATLATTGFSPAITTTALATPGTLALTLAAYAPAIVTPVTVTPGVLALSLTGYAPALTVAQRLYRNARMAAGAVAGGPRMQGGAARGPARTPGGVVRPT